MMTSTPPSKLVDILGESWVELGEGSPSSVVPQQLLAGGTQLTTQQLQGERGTPTPLVPPPPFSSVSDEYLRLLREAQRESNHSSARASVASSSRRDTPRGSPKSPPNSPNTEPSCCAEEDPSLKGYYINKELLEEESRNTDWVWDWSSRPDQAPPKDWKFRHPSPAGGRSSYSIRHAKVGKTSLFSREVLYTLLLTNVISLLLGSGIGVWLSRRVPEGGLMLISVE